VAKIGRVTWASMGVVRHDRAGDKNESSTVAAVTLYHETVSTAFYEYEYFW